ncbi:FkbM family methyltransferase [Flavobacterium sp.]|uniref:FkbM family methyltransferase n=1 Tax=Flavobacterium sp. TaxID=239 RepID=UPI0025DB6160|nr:FkbM family methyltransferase [Flavobacterium sp.]
MYYSQCKQDEFLNEVVFNNKKNGFFIDIGAHDGKTFSNSLFFELNNHWKGICVEPNPKVFAKLNSFRKSINLNVCIGAYNKSIKFTQIDGYAEMLSGISESYDERHIQRIDRDIETKGGNRIEIDVEMITINSIKMLTNQQVDFISIDTEGNEFDIVSSMNFDNLDVQVIVIENNFKDGRINEFLSKFNFIKLHELDFDDVYIHKIYLSMGIKSRLKIWKLKILIKRIKNKLKSFIR